MEQFGEKTREELLRWFGHVWGKYGKNEASQFMYPLPAVCDMTNVWLP